MLQIPAINCFSIVLHIGQGRIPSLYAALSRSTWWYELSCNFKLKCFPSPRSLVARMARSNGLEKHEIGWWCSRGGCWLERRSHVGNNTQDGDVGRESRCDRWIEVESYLCNITLYDWTLRAQDWRWMSMMQRPYCGTRCLRLSRSRDRQRVWYEWQETTF